MNSAGGKNRTEERTEPFAEWKLPTVRGRLTRSVMLSKMNWFRVGGAADWLFKPADVYDLCHFLASCPPEIPVTVLGVGSNLLVRDGGVAGIVVRLGRPFVDIRIEGNDIIAGAGALDISVARAACAAGLDGLSFLSGIPGTIGGGLRMNAGAYGGAISDRVVEVRAVAPDGKIHSLKPDELMYSYRSCALPEDWIFLEARLRGVAGDINSIAADMARIQEKREATQPIGSRTGGSSFANPPEHKAWWLIDQAGCRGMCWGGGRVSEKHANFLINTGTASAADLEGLGEQVRQRVLAHSGILLRWEIRRIGYPLLAPDIR